MKRGIILLATMFLLVGCASGAKQEEQPKPIEQTNESKVEKTTIEDTEYYSIVDNGDYTYSYCIKDEEGKVLLQDKNCNSLFCVIRNLQKKPFLCLYKMVYL